MAESNKRKRAKKLVRAIAKEHGYLDGEFLRRLDPETRREIEEALLEKDQMIGSSVITLAKNLYSSKARFVFELLQNADDNDCTKAKQAGSVPFVSFRVFPGKIVLECNEDRFSSKNLTAICSVGKSSKNSAQGYIGEKGIGFKSVFMKGDSGMGMISPVWEDTLEELKPPLTRITLHLHEASDEAARIRESIRSQFEEFQAKMLLFFKNIRKIQVEFCGGEGQRKSLVTYSITESKAGLATLTKIKTTNKISKTETIYFRFMRHAAKNMARNENRTYSESEEATRAYSKFEVILAFPVSETSIPIIEPQEIFAFLPVRPVGFNFLIQADFVTDASRQDIVKDSLRNANLLNAIAEAFVAAALGICEHGPLRLVTKIEKTLQKAPAFYDHKGSGGRLLSELVRVTPDTVDENEQPLLDDGEPAEIISRRYEDADLAVLESYGLQRTKFTHFLRWLNADLDDEDTSRIMSGSMTKHWHEKMAKKPLQAFTKQYTSHMEDIKEIDLIPLEDGTWVSTDSEPVYFPRFEDLEIPVDIGINLLSPAVKNSSRLRLFEFLRVKDATLKLVQQAIADLYEDDESLEELSLKASKQHLEFLYMTDHLKGGTCVVDLPVFDYDGILQTWTTDELYLADDDICNLWEVFEETDPGPNPGDGAPGYGVSFLDDHYFNDEPATPKGQTKSWSTWLIKYAHVREYVDFRPEAGTLSLEYDAQYIQKHRPDKFMECLLQLNGAQDEVLSSDTITCLRETKVLCRGNRQIPLKKAYFPVKRLERRVVQFLEENIFFPWIWVKETEVVEEITPKWKPLLSDLNVGRPNSDLEFALTMLKYSKEAFSPSLNSTSVARLFELYQHIQMQYTESKNRVAAAESIRFCVFVPVSSKKVLWVSPDKCVWNAPQPMESKFDLERLYQPWLSGDDVDSSILTAQFENEALIYFYSVDEASWFDTSECVWSRATKLRGKVSVADDYEDLEEFFVDYLGVKEVDLSMAIEELEDAASSGSEAVITEIKESIWVVNSLLSSVSIPPSPKSLSKSPIFPVRCPDGNVKTESVSTEFCIIDREPLEASFKSKVKLLDFTLKEVAQLRPFIEWIRLQDRFISRCVKEITSFDCGTSTPTPTLNPERQIRNRAHALLRVAAHFDSPRCQSKKDTDSFYDILLSAQIFETDRISSDLRLVQDGTPHVVKGKKTTLHIDEENSSLKVYLPRDREDHKYMFSNVLPQKLLEWMMRHPVTHISQDVTNGSLDAIKNIMLAPLSLITRALQDSGIAQIEVANRDEAMASEMVFSEPTASISRSGDNTGSVYNGPHPSNFSRLYSLDSTSSEDLINREVSVTVISSSQRRSNASPPRLVQRVLPMPSPGGIQNDTTNNTRYVSLLDNVISAGRRRRVNGLPVCGTFNMSQLQDNLPASRGDTDFGLRSAPQIERDCKIGAAGELFVYELLSHLYEDNSPLPQLPGFSRSSWQSTIRKYVTVHPEYANMSPWSGRETSDIVYQDTSNRLTALFIDKGYLQEQPRGSIGGGLNYFIEVKTTTMACETPFYMSKAQYQRMRDQVITENSDTVYVIFRVYNLGQVNMGYKVYLDPETLRRSEQLKFTAETWSVIPG
ncbi:hypothetical protein BDP81DRAFT_502426 [Colletotrichum phormii]|uniref:Protein NO VEIN C-terminal domain-containing protein n=1 Tax=Colletotrichum phormii TaxID=359342 RepID=A0AAI9ZH14_9PEZI|nr:uncharacterized protein BDP81DRAFT_502426 [Colletotrichum phormii]KAK1624073.1 hypothetical protein BDP81DRAFT_502426 [Colletotrichum phormii]